MLYIHRNIIKIVLNSLNVSPKANFLVPFKNVLAAPMRRRGSLFAPSTEFKVPFISDKVVEA
jgi:hypothetical protein